MTTTPTAFPELPDLDKLEAYATSSKSCDWHATEAMLNMLDEDDVLALVAAARRAHPKGEAPQAVSTWQQRLQKAHPTSEAAYWPDDLKAKYMAAEIDELRAATLSPLCGAQQNAELVVARLEQIVDGCDNASERAEEALICMHAALGGKEAAVFANDGAEPDWSSYAAAEAAPCPYCGGKDGQHDSAYPHPRAAQQAAAPVNSVEFDGIKTSAPGTPEAPSDKHLPYWERGIATVTLNGHQLREALDFINPDGEVDPDQLDDDLTFGIVQHEDDEGKAKSSMCCWNDDTDGVLPLDSEPRAAQLNGGQGEGQ